MSEKKIVEEPVAPANKEPELSDDQLAGISGGTEQVAAAPRDAASGLPTGKRMHKPFVVTGD